MNDPSVSPLVAEIQRLQHQLDMANQSIDDKLDKLEDAGLGVVGLTTQLEDARERIAQLEDELARLSRKEDRMQRRLQSVRCTKCRAKVDLRGLLTASTGDERYDVQLYHCLRWLNVLQFDPGGVAYESYLRATDTPDADERSLARAGATSQCSARQHEAAMGRREERAPRGECRSAGCGAPIEHGDPGY